MPNWPEGVSRELFFARPFYIPAQNASDVTKTRNGEWGMGNGKWEMEKWEMGNREWGMGNEK